MTINCSLEVVIRMKHVFAGCFFSLILFSISGCSTTQQAFDKNYEISQENSDGLKCLLILGQDPPDGDQVDYIRKKADDGNPRCLAILGFMYERGNVLPLDYARARTIYKQIGDEYPESYNLLASMLEQGKGGPIDYVGARELYERSYRAGGTDGAVKYAEFLADGKGGDQDENRAMSILFDSVKWYGDDAWKLIAVLNRRGVNMTTHQVNQYNKMWVTRIQKSLRYIARRQHIDSLQTLLEPTLPTRIFHLKLRFEQGIGKPIVTIREPSGYPEQESIILEAIENLEMKDPYISPSGQASLVIPVDLEI